MDIFIDKKVDEIFSNFGIPPDAEDLDKRRKSKYGEMVSDLLKNPNNACSYTNFINEVLVKDGTKLVLSCHDCRMEDGEGDLCDFAAIVLNVSVLHGLEGDTYQLTLLIVCSYATPKTITVNSLELGHCRWIEGLGTQYIYDNNKLGKIKNAIKMMSKYAPSTEVYLYSGWALNKENTYIMEGEELCSMSKTKK
jgi:hypothetical protein